MKTPPERRKTPEQGAATSVLVATSPLLAGVGGRYFLDCNEAACVPRRTWDMGGVAPYALDPGNADFRDHLGRYHHQPGAQRSAPLHERIGISPDLEEDLLHYVFRVAGILQNS